MKNTDIALSSFNTLRIYFKQGQGIPGATFWQRFWGSNLSVALLRQAKKAGIRQAIMFPVKAGFMSDTKLVFSSTEIIPPSLPVCIEITDKPEKMQSFITDNTKLLSSAFVVVENRETYQIITGL